MNTITQIGIARETGLPLARIRQIVKHGRFPAPIRHSFGEDVYDTAAVRHWFATCYPKRETRCRYGFFGLRRH